MKYSCKDKDVKFIIVFEMVEKEVTDEKETEALISLTGSHLKVTKIEGITNGTITFRYVSLNLE